MIIKVGKIAWTYRYRIWLRVLPLLPLLGGCSPLGVYRRATEIEEGQRQCDEKGWRSQIQITTDGPGPSKDDPYLWKAKFSVTLTCRDPHAPEVTTHPHTP